ncbi:hypothetical protein GCM10023310_70110 [Paenibacillus vulneris]|uniref:Uncharacterized protein n=1 Tax=Paenibacillus vulneris TaxID=1133364 RepID=A0ABW3UGK9_9BACL
MRKWKLERNEYWQNHNLYEDAPTGGQILTHIGEDELKRIRLLVEYHNRQVEQMETDERVNKAIKNIEDAMQTLVPHVKDREKHRFKSGSSNDAIYKTYWLLSSLLNELR